MTSSNSYYEKTLVTGAVRCIDDEIPFDIPQGWEWCRIKHVCSMQAGKNISSAEISQDKSDLHPYRCVGGNGLRGYVSSYNTIGHYAIVGRQGALCGCLNIENGYFYATEHAVVVDSFRIISPIFLYHFLTALNLNQYATATAQPGLAVSNVLEVLFPLPPLSEQARIVSKIETIVPFIRQYEKSEELLGLLNQRLHAQIKASILQEAIQGRLVTQIEAEGTAEELLEEIRAEKKRLVKEGKLKKSAIANESHIFRGDDNKYYEQIGSIISCIDDHIPFEIPSSWNWIRLGEFVSMNMGKTPPRGEQAYWSNGIYPWVSISDMVDGGKILNTREKISEIAASQIFHSQPSPKGSLLMSFKLTIGKISILDVDAYHNEAIVTINPFLRQDIVSLYLMTFLTMLSLQGDSKDAIKGKTLNSKSLYNILLPLPPLKEVSRIISKVKIVSSKI